MSKYISLEFCELPETPHDFDRKKFEEKDPIQIKLYKDNIKYIENSFKYDINNGVIEGKNNLIKCIKRIAFGYRKYDHFVARVFLISGMIKG